MRSDGTPSNYWITFCRACEAAHDRYKASAEACRGDEAAIAKIILVSAAEPFPGRWDRMGPHLNRCRFVNPSVVATSAGGRGSVRSGGSAAAPASYRMEVPTVDEEAMRHQLGVTKAQLDGVRAYLDKIVSGASGADKKRRAARTLDSFFTRALTSLETTEWEKHLLLMVADLQMSFSAVEHESFINFVAFLRHSAVERLPYRRQLGGRILKLAADEAATTSKNAVKRLLRGSATAALMLDGYKRSNNIHVFGAVVGIVGERHILDSGEEGHNQDGIATAAETASVIDRLAT